ncbi:hypothetical protein [Actinoplanes utahensis]|uniref:Uncharacterized protein n=1 Tax=Actinoplanes utahensis TaxID=1869 RepID=A0A0A6UEF6_ACTUT|nr:hypothetical protein [Actinoplanes utahensis]KHD73458.1 hypothetical protein MB27_35265 [Actinoplanes utahensis]GIF30249.1 hypothetical protein Aut01nite_32350 [Actinoplanes utahensis]
MRIDLNRGSRGSALLTLAVTGVFGFAAASGALFPERFLTTPGLTERIISGICAVVILPAFVFSIAWHGARCPGTPSPSTTPGSARSGGISWPGSG